MGGYKDVPLKFDAYQLSVVSESPESCNVPTIMYVLFFCLVEIQYSISNDAMFRCAEQKEINDYTHLRIQRPAARACFFE